MKKLVVFLIIISIFVSLTVFVTFATFNRYSSYVMKEINTSYGPLYGAPTILSIDRTGSDYDGPLSSTASTWKGCTDDGYNGGINPGRSFYHPQETERALEEILSSGQFFRENVFLSTYWDNINNAISGYWAGKNYDKKFTISAYAYISCSTSYERYKTTCNKLHVKVPAWLTIFDPFDGSSNERNPHTHEVLGSFSKSEYVAGDTDGWNYELSPDYAVASVDATGTNPSSGATHNTIAFAPNEVDAVDIITE